MSWKNNQDSIFFSPPPCPDRLWGPTNLSSGYGGLLPRLYISRGVKPTAHLHTASVLKIRWAFSQHFLWCTAMNATQTCNYQRTAKCSVLRSDISKQQSTVHGIKPKRRSLLEPAPPWKPEHSYRRVHDVFKN
jgi:hypothetical protein